MKLYHGTSAAAVPGILEHGIKPRGKNGTSNWKRTIESNPEAVYLTNAYALHFAANATKEKERMAVVEIDSTLLSPLRLCPDEDFLEQATRKQNDPGLAPMGKSMKYRTRWYRRHIREFSQFWDASLEHMGTCCHYGVIPVEAIIRVAFINAQTYAAMVWTCGLDPMISVMNYRFAGEKYRHSMARMFGDTEEEYLNMLLPHVDPEKMTEARREIWAQVEIQEVRRA